MEMEQTPFTDAERATINRVNAGIDNISAMIKEELKKLSPDEKVKFILIVEPHGSPGMVANTNCRTCLVGMLGEMMSRVIAGEGREGEHHSGPAH